MGVLNIRKAGREGSRLVIGLTGISGSGKTFSALMLAYGLANGDGSKVGFLDTENKRGSLYASDKTFDMAAQQMGMPEPVDTFMVGDLEPPFSPRRYIDAIQEFQDAGVEVLVIDSISHEWEGTGGCEEIAHAGNPKFPKWNDAKREHKRFMNALLQSNMHIICCIRAREKVRVEGGGKVVQLGILPITEKNVMFEMTASLMMWDEGKSQEVQKCPEELRPILGRENGHITAADGKALRAWVDGGKKLDNKLEEWRNKLRTNTEQGEAHIRACWSKTPKKVQDALGDAFFSNLVASAQAFDEMREAEKGTDGAAVDELNSELEG